MVKNTDGTASNDYITQAFFFLWQKLSVHKLTQGNEILDILEYNLIVLQDWVIRHYGI